MTIAFESNGEVFGPLLAVLEIDVPWQERKETLLFPGRNKKKHLASMQKLQIRHSLSFFHDPLPRPTVERGEKLCKVALAAFENVKLGK